MTDIVEEFSEYCYTFDFVRGLRRWKWKWNWFRHSKYYWRRFKWTSWKWMWKRWGKFLNRSWLHWQISVVAINNWLPKNKNVKGKRKQTNSYSWIFIGEKCQNISLVTKILPKEVFPHQVILQLMSKRGKILTKKCSVCLKTANSWDPKMSLMQFQSELFRFNISLHNYTDVSSSLKFF